MLASISGPYNLQWGQKLILYQLDQLNIQQIQESHYGTEHAKHKASKLYVHDIFTSYGM